MTAVRIAHMADTHLGYRTASRLDPESGRNQRTVDVDAAFTRTIDDILEQQVDAVIHAGDVFHHARPTWQSLRHFITEMRRLERAGIPTLVLGGNHDTPRIRTGGSAYSVLELALGGITFVCGYEAESPPVFDRLGIAIQAIPHGALTNPDPPLAMAPVAKRINVMVMHGVVPGVLPDSLMAEPGEQDIPSHLLDVDSVDYVALGHIHEHQQMQTNSWYCGSTERFGWGDQKATPGYLVVELDSPLSPPQVSHRPIEARPMIRLATMDGNDRSASELADAILAELASFNQPEAMTRIDLRDAGRPARREVQSLLQRTSMEHVWSFDLAAERTRFVPESAEQPADDAALDLHSLFAEFVDLRAPTYPGKDFAAIMRERGGKALTDAMLEEEAPNPEDDSLP